MKKILKGLCSFAILTIGLTVISSCNKSESDTMTITDCSGAKVKIARNVEKVIAPNQPFCSFMIAMGEGDKLIGSHGSVIGHSWAPYFKEDILSVEMYGYKPNAEALYDADADLVVVKNSAYAEALRKQGIPAIYFAYNTYEELKYAVNLMGDIFGDNAKSFANKWIDLVDTTISEIQTETSNLKDEEKKKIYYVNAAVNPGDLYTTFGGNSFVEYWIETIGGKLVTSKYKDIETIDQEVAISLNPEVVFISGYAEYTRYDEIKKDPLWSDITAIKNNDIYLMPTSLVSYERFAVELPLLLEYSANVLYPELHSFDGLIELREFNKDIYGKEFSDELLNNMLLGLNPDGSRMD